MYYLLFCIDCCVNILPGFDRVPLLAFRVVVAIATSGIKSQVGDYREARFNQSEGSWCSVRGQQGAADLSSKVRVSGFGFSGSKNRGLLQTGS